MDSDQLAALNHVNSTLADSTLIVHPRPDAPPSLIVDASDISAGGVLQPFHEGNW